MLSMAIAPSVDLLVYFFLLVIYYSFKRSPMGTCATRDSNTRASVDTTSYFSANPVIMENIHKNLTCEICSQKFNHHERCPMMLCPNQHNTCKQCLDRLKQNQCPFCRIQFSRAKVAKNRMLLEMIEQENLLSRQPQQIVIIGNQARSRGEEKKESEWWNLVSDHKPENKQLIKQTLKNAKENKYEQVVYWILMALKKPIANVQVIEEYQKDIPSMIDLSIFKGLETLRISSSLQSKSIAKNGLKGFGYLPKLKTLQLSSRHARQIYYLGLLPRLEVLDLSVNQIERIQNLDQFTKLKHLNLSNNKIKVIEKLDKLGQLQVLKLSFNQIEGIQHLDNLINLKQLYLDNNLIKEISNLEGLTELELLSLIDNRINRVQNLHFLEKLKKVAIAGNPIVKDTCQMEIKALRDLFEIDL